MSQSDIDKGRRKALKLALSGAVAVPLSSLLVSGRVQAGDLPHVDPESPAAKGLNYVHNAADASDPKHKDDQFCKNCNLIRAEEGEWRPCAIFPGKAVNENGWCTAWVLKS